MLNFEEELSYFKPSKEISALEEEMIKTDIGDLNDILLDILKQEVGEEY